MPGGAKEALRFLVVGGINTLWGYGLIFGFMYLAGWSPEASNIAGYLISFVMSYALHRRFTFRSENAKRREFLRYVAVFAVAFCANLAALGIFIHGFGLHEGLSQVGAGGVYVLTAYLLGKLYVFRKTGRDRRRS